MSNTLGATSQKIGSVRHLTICAICPYVTLVEIASLNTLFESRSCVPLGGELFNATRSIVGNIYTFALAGTNGGVEGGNPGRFLNTLDRLYGIRPDPFHAACIFDFVNALALIRMYIST